MRRINMLTLNLSKDQHSLIHLIFEYFSSRFLCSPATGFHWSKSEELPLHGRLVIQFIRQPTTEIYYHCFSSHLFDLYFADCCRSMLKKKNSLFSYGIFLRWNIHHPALYPLCRRNAKHDTHRLISLFHIVWCGVRQVINFMKFQPLCAFRILPGKLFELKILSAA